MTSSIVPEDLRYLASTQYRLWSFTPTDLQALRTTTNQFAADRVREAVRRDREAPEGEVDYLTVEEERKLITFFCRQTIQLADHLKLPTDVKATAIQYLKRFYTTNSLMTYAPEIILHTALFFATKTESHYFALSKFVEEVADTKPENILASEFLLTQGLRFTFDVRHPFRALDGAVMEIGAIAQGAIPYNEAAGAQPHGMSRRVRVAHGAARELLKTNALLTDVYFHFTPSQIMMAALLLADEELIHWYLAAKFGPEDQMAQKILIALSDCATMLQAIEPDATVPGPARKAVSALMKKFKKCRNPDNADLVALQRVKREGAGGEDEKVIKKRKLERDKVAKEADELFGPGLTKA